jgi:hypothetical protein
MIRMGRRWTCLAPPTPIHRIAWSQFPLAKGSSVAGSDPNGGPEQVDEPSLTLVRRGLGWGRALGCALFVVPFLLLVGSGFYRYYYLDRVLGATRMEAAGRVLVLVPVAMLTAWLVERWRNS